jgi:hypothetical protein
MKKLRDIRMQGLTGWSMNGYTFLLIPGGLVPLFAMAWEYRATGSGWAGEVLGVLWFVGLIASFVVATKDDAREGTGRWYGKNGRFSDRRDKPEE